MAASAGPEIERLIALLSKLPGLGPRSARRAALALLKRKDQLLTPLAEAVGAMLAHGINCLPVVSGGKLCGIVTSTDIYLVLERLLQRVSAEVAR